MKNVTKTVFAFAALAVITGSSWQSVQAAQEAASSTGSGALATATPKKPRVKKTRSYDAAKTTTTTTKKTTTRVRGTAYTRVLHGIQGGPNVDVYIDGKKVLSDVGYKTVSDYMAIPTGKHLFKITKSGQNDALLTSNLANAKDKFYTIAAYGTAEKPLLLRINETTGKEIEGQARVYVVHLAQAPAVDVTMPLERNKTMGYGSFLKAVPAGTARAKSAMPGDVKLQVRADGKVLKEAEVKIEAGKRYTVFALGSASSLDLIVKTAAEKPVSTSH